jgi:hypothetical protein
MTMNFDILSTVELTASAALVVATIAVMFGRTLVERTNIIGGLTIWFIAVLAAGATGALGNEHGLGTPGLGAAAVLPIVMLSAIAFAARARGTRLTEAPLSALVAIQAVRVLGITFVLLYAARRLPAPFAPIAGWGDFGVGLLAIPLAWWAAHDPRGARGSLILWNALGIFDLAVAVFLGATSSPGPIRLFFQPPGAAIMTTLPWIIIPCFLVPSLMFVHFATLYRMRRDAGIRAPRSTVPAY